MRRTYTIGVRLSEQELASLVKLRELRGLEGMGQTIRALIREELCRNEEKEALELAIAKHATAGTN